jgi:hypothetical protein
VERSAISCVVEFVDMMIRKMNSSKNVKKQLMKEEERIKRYSNKNSRNRRKKDFFQTCGINLSLRKVLTLLVKIKMHQDNLNMLNKIPLKHNRI